MFLFGLCVWGWQGGGNKCIAFLKNKTSQQKSAAEVDIEVVVRFWRVHFFILQTITFVYNYHMHLEGR